MEIKEAGQSSCHDSWPYALNRPVVSPHSCIQQASYVPYVHLDLLNTLTCLALFAHTWVFSSSFSSLCLGGKKSPKSQLTAKACLIPLDPTRRARPWSSFSAFSSPMKPSFPHDFQHVGFWQSFSSRESVSVFLPSTWNALKYLSSLLDCVVSRDEMAGTVVLGIVISSWSWDENLLKSCQCVRWEVTLITRLLSASREYGESTGFEEVGKFPFYRWGNIN